MSCIAFAPLREIAIDTLQVRQHRSLFMHNHLPKQSSAQASWWCPKKLAPKPLAPSNRWTIALLMTTSVRKIPAPGTSATPLAINPVQRVAGRVAPRAREPRPDPALPPAHGRHGPLAQDDLNLDPARLDHNHASAGPGKPRMEGVGLVSPLQDDRSVEPRDSSDGQAWCIADEAATWTRVQTRTERSDHFGEILF
jgi:hypothetical protein